MPGHGVAGAVQCTRLGSVRLGGTRGRCVICICTLSCSSVPARKNRAPANCDSKMMNLESLPPSPTHHLSTKHQHFLSQTRPARGRCSVAASDIGADRFSAPASPASRSVPHLSERDAWEAWSATPQHEPFVAALPIRTKLSANVLSRCPHAPTAQPPATASASRPAAAARNGRRHGLLRHSWCQAHRLRN